MKKLMLLAALLAMLVVAAVPALAQVTQDLEQEAESGELEQSVEATQEGDNSIQCFSDNLVGNTGNAQSQNAVLQYASSGSPSPSGDSDVTFDEVFSTTECDAQVNQAASAAA